MTNERHRDRSGKKGVLLSSPDSGILSGTEDCGKNTSYPNVKMLEFKKYCSSRDENGGVR